ncbi:sulfotransferase domain-containing protein [Rhodosalinus sp.]|uniref:sulfotransferase domain-containing protein n=1 Tax=Rhodosalinus sp. TaxID=2047741 RepID=UPI003565F995
MDGRDYLIILGAPKCGTTSLAGWMAQWPETAVARGKETLYFTDYTARSWTGPGAGYAAHDGGTDEGFRARFDHAPNAALRVEASTDNLSCPLAPERIARFSRRPDVGRVRLVAVVRDPVDRIVSEFEHTLRLGWQGRSLMRSLRREPGRVASMHNPLFWHLYRSRYAEQIARFRRECPDLDLLILDYHRLGEPEVLRRLACFAGRASSQIPDRLERRNARHVVARPQAQAVLRKGALVRAGRMVVPPSLRKRVRAALLGGAAPRYEPTPRERAFILDGLAEDIAASVADPEIPTDCWTCLDDSRVA